MVDEYNTTFIFIIITVIVQIPLWSMNTCLYNSRPCFLSEFRFLYGRWILFLRKIRKRLQRKFRFLYGRWILSKPSSGQFNLTFRFLYGRWIHRCWLRSDVNNWVQIPLWSMNTPLTCLYVTILDRFRFLYGRWIRALRRRIVSCWILFRFLYGRWIRVILRI